MKNRLKKQLRRKEGQAMVEYIIIVVVVAIAALVVFGFFGDTIQEKLSGAVKTLDPDSEVQVRNSMETLQSLDEEGIE